ncbi:acyltransferase [Pseudorhodoferax sp. Leaf267]|uniref:acyltransferase family protein n=1 Tax=Pseudorhodoferax sp. Leaf267 TaxID=1736316 RepID=UPI00138F75ED|nr:acyltransferase [Pseudorhodoferax sp. Leaf267]
MDTPPPQTAGQGAPAPTALAPLTSIRGIAALAVVLLHINDTFRHEHLVFLRAFENGWLGVDLFFVLSGFIMAHVYTRTPVRGRAGAFTIAFLQARLARIYPLHLATLLAALALVLWLPGFGPRYPTYFGAGSFVLNLLLVQNWGFIGSSWNMVSWSISAEWFMYLLFPLMLLARQALWPASERRAAALVFVLIACTLGLHHAVILARGWSDYGGMSASGMVRVFFEFVLGFLVYHVRDRLHPRPGGLVFEVYGLALWAAVLLAFLDRRYWFVFVPAVAMLIATLGSNRGITARLLGLRPMVYLGEISFSLYMWHWLVIQVHNLLRDQGPLAIDSRVGIYLQCLSMALLSLLLAALSYAWIEKPARAWINRRAARARGQRVTGRAQDIKA